MYDKFCHTLSPAVDLFTMKHLYHLFLYRSNVNLIFGIYENSNSVTPDNHEALFKVKFIRLRLEVNVLVFYERIFRIETSYSTIK